MKNKFMLSTALLLAIAHFFMRQVPSVFHRNVYGRTRMDADCKRARRHCTWSHARAIRFVRC